MLDGLREDWDELAPSRGILIGCVLSIAIWALVIWLLMTGLGWAQQAAYSDCSGSVGAASAPVSFPRSGTTGPSAPTEYVQICDTHATQQLGINAAGGTAALAGNGTETYNPTGCRWWAPPSRPPAAINVIGSGSSTTYSCTYR